MSNKKKHAKTPEKKNTPKPAEFMRRKAAASEPTAAPIETTAAAPIETTAAAPTTAAPAANEPAPAATEVRDDAPAGDATAADTGATAAATGAAEPKERTPDERLPPIGTVIIKRDRADHERVRCAIVEGGVEYAGKVYRSLSGAAMAAAKDLGLGGKTQNGFAFWGITKPARGPADSLAALATAWERYRGRVEALVKDGVTDANRADVQAAIGRHAQVVAEFQTRIA